MALASAIRAAQFVTRAVAASVAPLVDAATFIARAIVTYPTPYIQAAQLFVRGVFGTHTVLQVPQFIVRAVIFSFPGNPKVRAWGYSQDGHDFYVLHLGAQGTIVYDATTGSWSAWDSSNRLSQTWRASQGLDWIGMAKANYAGGAATQIVAGDENLGVLWTLDPTAGVDQSPADPTVEVPFIRSVRGGVPMTERNNKRANALWLRISTGEPTYTDTSITMRSSNDQGVNWTDHGSVAVIPGDYSQTIYWRSLGLIKPPMRIFEFIDVGAAVRIDGSDIDFK